MLRTPLSALSIVLVSFFVRKLALGLDPGARNCAGVAKKYLHGLMQAEDCNISSMADVVENSCPQQFQHFISNSPWDEDRVLDQISKDADRLFG
jgi:SRSO17 transposase